MENRHCRCLGLVGALALLPVVLAAQTDLPVIRHVDGAPDAAAWIRADVCTRFVEVKNNSVARNPSEARLLFDDRNLYVALKGFFDARYVRGSVKDDVEAVNNFEFFIRLPGCDPVQVIVDEFARLYVDKAQSEVHNTGVSAKVEKGKDWWTAYVTIPFAFIGAAAPTDDVTAKVGIFRQNVNVHPREKLFSARRVASGFTPNDYKYRVADTWADMTFTRKAGAARRVEGPTFGRRINVFPDPDFNVPGTWGACGKTEYRETMAMSGEWTYRSAGKDYQFLQVGARQLKPSTRYTLVVKARSFGAGSALRIVQFARDPKKGVRHEGPYVTGHHLELGSEMHEYFLPFTTHADPSDVMAFYKVDNKADDTGVEIASVHCYEGEISSFEVRKLSRPGRMAIVKGTEVPLTPNPIGRFARPFRVLAFVSNKYQHREPAEIFAGTGADVDVLELSDKASDIYSTYGDEREITQRTSKGAYDLVMVPAGGAPMVGKEMVKLIRAGVEKGGGLYIDMKKNDLGLLAPLVKAAKGGKLGKGRVETVKLAGGLNPYLPFAGDREEAFSLFPSDAGRMRVAAAVWRMVDAGRASALVVSEKRASLVYAGRTWTSVRKLGVNGATVDWVESSEHLAGPSLGAFADDGKVSTVVVSNAVPELALSWQFRDFSGRILAKGTETQTRKQPNAPTSFSFVVPREKLYTNFGGIRLALVKDGREIDVRGEGIFVRANDRRRLMDDYTPSMWPDQGYAVNEQLQDIGIRAAIIASGSGNHYACTLGSGIACGGGWLDGAWTFRGLPAKANVRPRNFNTKQFYQNKPGEVRRQMQQTYAYGILDAALRDEPDLSSMHGADEVDAHPENLAEYRIRMERKYGTIAEYNRRHRTTHADFSSVGQGLLADARKSGCAAEFIEWRNFNVDRWCEAIKLVSDSAHAVDDAPFTICNTFGQSAFSGNDYYKLFTRAGIDFMTEYMHTVYFSRTPINNMDEFIRSFRPDMRCWGWTGYFYTHGHARFMPWWTACHRYGGFSWYHATSPGYNVIDATTRARTIDGEDLRQSLLDTRLLDGFGKVLTCWAWAPRDVAIYYSHDSLLLSTVLGTELKNREVAATGPLHDHMESRQGVQYTVEDLLYQHDFVAPEQITAQNRLASVKALLVPRVLAMSETEVASVKTFLARGGKMMCDVLPGDYDELGVRRAANPFAGLDGITVLGKNFNDLDKDCRAAVKAFLESTGATKALACDDTLAHFGREAMHYVSGDADLYTVIRDGGRSEDDDALTYRFAKKGHVYDVQVRKYLGVTDRVTAKTKLDEGTAFAVLPAKIDGIDISAPETLVRGDTLSAEFAISQKLAADRSQPAYVLHVEVVPPSGKVRFHFKRNLMTQGGKVHLDFPMAFNDEPGTWILRVTEPLTGVTAEHTVNMRDAPKMSSPLRERGI